MDPRQRPRWRSRAWPVTATVTTVLLFCVLATGPAGIPFWVVPSVIAAILVVAVAWAVRRTRADRAAYEARLTRWAADEAIVAERMRIARDLHDLVSHGLGLITVRAAAARMAADPREARAALSDIETTGRGATAELRRMLTVLRTPDEAAPRLPVDGLDRLPSIVAAVEPAGLRVRLEVGPLGEVSPGVQVAICRTVREGLHNAARHAGPCDVRVHVHRDGDTVTASVADTGPDTPVPGPRPGAGHGLLGLRERVAALGGTLEAGPVDGGFRLGVRIPDRAAG